MCDMKCKEFNYDFNRPHAYLLHQDCCASKRERKHFSTDERMNKIKKEEGEADAGWRKPNDVGMQLSRQGSKKKAEGERGAGDEAGKRKPNRKEARDVQ